MIALFLITNAYSCAVIASAGQMWVTGLAVGLRLAIELAAAAHRPEHPHPPIKPHVYVSHALPRPVVRWPSGN